ncbi:glycine dehydrogenase subunit 2 [Bacteroidetes/Chlorobi group bacterium Naka2016]|jgi:glycine dehydrogenase subunit 2|nr:MAG: glycine dehydrogenase subunit 2 [Bacteroidetes/Chlorobi group bacterium Naka2016]
MEKLIFEKSVKGRRAYSLPVLGFDSFSSENLLPERFRRRRELNLPELSEVEVARHFVKLSKLNYCIEDNVYPLGSCTMKYNPKVNEKVATLDGFSTLHPHIDEDSCQGALQLMYELGESLKKITGFTGVTLQPASGSQGELTGLLLIRAYHLDRGDTKRNKILIPDSAHGTNPASSAIAGFQVITIKSDEDGRVSLEDLKKYCDETVAGFMLTNPNTVGLFEKNILEISKLIHDCGGLMYMDGANLNALLGIVYPAEMGFDCMHINLHKTFSTPHGGGGPGAGPVCVNDKLEPYLPVPQITFDGQKYHLNYDVPKTIGKLHSFFGNFLVFVRAYTYILMNGTEGLQKVSKGAIINANYLLSKLKDVYRQPYNEHCMHEFVITGENQKKFGVTTKDIAKRILDFGFYAPTIYFPLIVHEAMLVEPTETEAKERLDEYANVFLQIAKEAETNPEILLTAPHNTPVRRVDDARAARIVNVNYFKGETKG